jgi:hypothetical protein
MNGSSTCDILPLIGSDAIINRLEQVLTAYNTWLDQQLLAANTQSAHSLQVHQYRVFLAQRPPAQDDPLSHPFARGHAVRNDKIYLKTERRATLTSVDLRLQLPTISTSFLAVTDQRFRGEKHDLSHT